MPTVRSLDELRDALSAASSADKIDLAPGEYRGPLLIDKPVTLRGLDRQTVLWRRAGPVIWVRTPGVILDKLLIERTVHTQGPLVVHNQGCVPKGKDSMTIDALISLGDLLPGSTITLPLELETAARAEIDTSAVYGARVTPSTLDTAGKHLVWLTLDGKTIQRNELLLGEIAIREGGQTRYLWLSGTAVEAPPEALVHPLYLATKQIRFYLSTAAMLGPMMATIKTDKAALDAANRVYIQRESSGGLYLFTSAEVNASVNDQPIIRWTRLPLVQGDVLNIAGTSFTVQAIDSVPISVEPETITFADFDANFPEAASLTVRNGKVAWKGRALSTVPWLDVLPAEDVRIPPSRFHTWSVQLNAAGLNLPNGPHDALGGVLVVGPNHVLGLDVHTVIRRPDVALVIGSVDAGSVEWGWPVPADRTTTLTIGNLGRGSWTGTVRSNVSWLEVMTDMPVSCGPWSEVTVQLRLTPSWESILVGMLDVFDALTVSGPNEEYPAAAHLEVTAAQGHLTPLVDQIAFDEVELNAPLPDATLTVRNDGAAPWTGNLRAANGWIRIQPAAIAVAPGTTADIEISLLDVPAEAVIDTPLTIDEIQFESTGPAEAVPPVNVRVTLVEMPPYLVVSPVSFPPFVRGDPTPEGSLRLQNMGPTRWRGEVTTALPWLTVPDQIFACEAGDTLDILITLKAHAVERLENGFSRFDNALSITGGREPVSVAVDIDIREAVSELQLETPTLNFGQIDGTALILPAETVRLVNASPVTWKGKVELCVPWLSIDGLRMLDFEVPGMHTAEFPVTLEDTVRWLAPGVIAEDRALIISGQDQQLTVRALLFIQEWTPALSVMPEKLTFASDAPQTLTIRNTGQKSWTLQISPATWLAASSADLTLNAGQEQKIEIKPTIKEAISDSRAIVIVGPGREIEVGVVVSMVQPS